LWDSSTNKKTLEATKMKTVEQIKAEQEQMKNNMEVNAFGEWDDADADKFFANYLANKKQTKKQ
jgi:hypothetical protein